jgi:LAO/AO transport system kinase
MLYKEVKNMVHMGKWVNGWEPPVLMVESVMEPHTFIGSVSGLYEKIEEHYQHLVDKDILADRTRRKLVIEMNDALRASILDPILAKLTASGELDSMVAQLKRKESDPYSLAEAVAQEYLKDYLCS